MRSVGDYYEVCVIDVFRSRLDAGLENTCAALLERSMHIHNVLRRRTHGAGESPSLP